MSIDKTKGFLIQKKDFRETSVIATFFTKDFGKVKGLLKGCRADRNKFGSNLELFSLNEIVFYRNTRGEIHLISQCDSRQDFTNLRKKLERINLASYAANLVEAVMNLEDKNESVFNLLGEFFNSLSNGDDTNFLKKIIEIKLLSLSGFKPYLDSCIICSSPIRNQARFSFKLGGLVCPNCYDKDEIAGNISQGAIASLLHLEKNDWQEASRLKLNKPIDDELHLILQEFLNYHVDFQISPALAGLLKVK